MFKTQNNKTSQHLHTQQSIRRRCCVFLSREVADRDLSAFNGLVGGERTVCGLCWRNGINHGIGLWSYDGIHTINLCSKRLESEIVTGWFCCERDDCDSVEESKFESRQKSSFLQLHERWREPSDMETKHRNIEEISFNIRATQKDHLASENNLHCKLPLAFEFTFPVSTHPSFFLWWNSIHVRKNSDVSSSLLKEFLSNCPLTKTVENFQILEKFVPGIVCQKKLFFLFLHWFRAFLRK